MRSCKDISFLVSQSLDRKLALRERLGLHLHLMMCNACRCMADQMKLLQAASLHYQITEGLESHSAQQALSREASDRILARLQQAARERSD
ncbi:MAG: zf-HC2 domain-containing protein [Thiogranum sp.]|nr:zf-HC2 domain-containing protein [Thiogranum sp.]